MCIIVVHKLIYTTNIDKTGNDSEQSNKYSPPQLCQDSSYVKDHSTERLESVDNRKNQINLAFIVKYLKLYPTHQFLSSYAAIKIICRRSIKYQIMKKICKRREQNYKR